VRFRAIVLATGTHDGAIAVPGNDLPGVMSARAVCSLTWRGVVPTEGVFVVGAGPWGDRLALALGDRVRGRADASTVEAIVGTSRVKAIRLRGGNEVRVGIVAIATSPAPAFELAVQAGASTRRTEGGFAVAVDAVGRAAPAVYAVGGCADIDDAPSARVAQARATAAAIVEDLAASNVALDR
jgi:sarcosine oxidase subunit alpha